MGMLTETRALVSVCSQALRVGHEGIRRIKDFRERQSVASHLAGRNLCSAHGTGRLEEGTIGEVGSPLATAEGLAKEARTGVAIAGCQETVSARRLRLHGRPKMNKSAK